MSASIYHFFPGLQSIAFNKWTLRYLEQRKKNKYWKFAFFFKILFIYLTETQWDREYKQWEREKQVFPLRREPDAGLDSQAPGIMTWAKEQMLNNWATQAPLEVSFLHSWKMGFCTFMSFFCPLVDIFPLEAHPTPAPQLSSKRKGSECHPQSSLAFKGETILGSCFTQKSRLLSCRNSAIIRKRERYSLLEGGLAQRF